MRFWDWLTKPNEHRNPQAYSKWLDRINAREEARLAAKQNADARRAELREAQQARRGRQFQQAGLDPGKYDDTFIDRSGKFGNDARTDRRAARFGDGRDASPGRFGNDRRTDRRAARFKDQRDASSGRFGNERRTDRRAARYGDDASPFGAAGNSGKFGNDARTDRRAGSRSGFSLFRNVQAEHDRDQLRYGIHGYELSGTDAEREFFQDQKIKRESVNETIRSQNTLVRIDRELTTGLHAMYGDVGTLKADVGNYLKMLGKYQEYNSKLHNGFVKAAKLDEALRNIILEFSGENANNPQKAADAIIKLRLLSTRFERIAREVADDFNGAARIHKAFGTDLQRLIAMLQKIDRESQDLEEHEDKVLAVMDNIEQQIGTTFQLAYKVTGNPIPEKVRRLISRLKQGGNPEKIEKNSSNSSRRGLRGSRRGGGVSYSSGFVRSTERNR